MENAIITLICIALILTGTLTVAQASFFSVDLMYESWKELEERTGEIMRTNITSVSTVESGPYTEMHITNSGGVSLSDFASWDVIVEYMPTDGDYTIIWLPYDEGTHPANNTWVVEEILYNSSPEVFEPGILNPGEELVILMKLVGPPEAGIVNRTVVAAPNGVAIPILWEK